MSAQAQIDAHLECIKVKVGLGKSIQFHIDGICRAVVLLMEELKKK